MEIQRLRANGSMDAPKPVGASLPERWNAHHFFLTFHQFMHTQTNLWINVIINHLPLEARALPHINLLHKNWCTWDLRRDQMLKPHALIRGLTSLLAFWSAKNKNKNKKSLPHFSSWTIILLRNLEHLLWRRCKVTSITRIKSRIVILLQMEWESGLHVVPSMHVGRISVVRTW